MYGTDKSGRYVVTIDEPETHLHPSMQRELLPNLLRAFPDTQFVVATHSPFVATSAPDARVYTLTYNPERRVVSHLLERQDLSGTANQTLREILGVTLSVPVWVEAKLNEIAAKYRGRLLTDGDFLELRRELRDSGLGAFLPEAADLLRKPNA
jgi:YD repeat-containing protein